MTHYPFTAIVGESDHTPFQARRFSAVTTHSGGHGPAHTPEDAIDHVSFGYAKKNTQLGLPVPVCGTPIWPPSRRPRTPGGMAPHDRGRWFPGGRNNYIFGNPHPIIG